MLTLRRVPSGDGGQVYSVAFSADGTILASGAYDGGVRLWDVASGGLVRTLLSHDGWVLAVACAPEGATVASGGGGDNRIRLWDAASGDLLRVLPPHGRHIEHLAYAPDGALLASSSGDGTVRLWDTRDWRVAGVLTGHGDDVGSVAFSIDGEAIVTASDDGTVRVWDVASATCRQTWRWQALPLLWAEFSRDASSVVTGGYRVEAKGGSAGEVRFWDVATGELRVVLDVAADAVFCLIHSPDGGHLVCGTADGQLLVYGAQDRTFVKRIEAHAAMITKLALHPAGRTLASASFDGTVRLWTCAWR